MSVYPWSTYFNWMYAMSLEEAYPLSHGNFRYQDQECDIVQSAAVGRYLTEMVRIFNTAWRHQPITPEGEEVRKGMRVLPRAREMVFVRQFLLRDRSFITVEFNEQNEMIVESMCKLILPDNKWHGQFAVRLMSGNFLPIDHRMFCFC